MSFDIQVQRGTVDYGASADSFDETISAVASTSSAFARLTNSQNGSRGTAADDNTNTKNNDDVGSTCLLNSTTNIQFLRSATGENLDHRFAYEVWEYIGDAGGPNEFIVRQQGIRLIVAGVNSDSVDISGAGVVDYDKCAVVLCSIADTTASPIYAVRPTLRIDSVGETIEAERTTTSGRTVYTYALIEFTGSNWTVEEVTHVYSAAGTDETETISDVGSWADAFIFASHHTDQAGLDETGHTVRPGATTTSVRFRLRSGATVGGADERDIVYVVSNPTISVQHDDSIAGSLAELASGNNTQAYTITAVANVSNAGVLGYADCNGGGTAYPRQFWNYTLTNTTTVTFDRARNGQASDAAIQVIEFPQRVVEGDVAASAGAATVTITTQIVTGGRTNAKATTADVTFDAQKIVQGDVTAVAAAAPPSPLPLGSAQKISQTAMTVEASAAVVAAISIIAYKVTGAVVAEAATATTTIPAQLVHQTSVAAQAATATVTIDADKVVQTVVTVAAGAAQASLDAQLVHQTSVAAQAATATVTIDGSLIQIEGSAAVQADSATVSILGQRVVQTTTAVQAGAAVTVFSMELGLGINAAVQAEADPATTQIVGQKVIQGAVTAVCAPATASVVGALNIEASLALQASPATATISAQKVIQTVVTVQASPARARIQEEFGLTTQARPFVVFEQPKTYTVVASVKEHEVFEAFKEHEVIAVPKIHDVFVPDALPLVLNTGIAVQASPATVQIIGVVT